MLAGLVGLTDGWAASVPPKPAEPAPALAAPTSLESFGKISDRNIFNANRFGPVVRRAEEPPRVTRTVVVESFSLLGTLEYPKGLVAFFEGSSASHRKAAKVDESIGGCKITGIEPNLVRLEANGKPMELRVGYMLHRENEGEWKTREAERPSDYGSSYTSSSSSGSSSFPSSSYGSSSSFSRDRDSRSGSSRDSRSSSPFGSNETPAESAQRRIREQDRNGDGKVSRSEADSRLRDRFRDMDRNRDDQIDAEEYTAYYASRMSGSSSGTPSPSTFSNASSPGSFGGSTPAGSSSSPPASAPSAPSSGGSGESDLLRRLMEQRARENR